MAKQEEITTTDLSRFGYRELKIAGVLLTAYTDRTHQSPVNFENDGVQVMMNTSSGNVFLVNSEYQVAMMNGDKLESFYSCPECGHEGFAEEMKHGEDNKDCQRYLKEIGVIEDTEEA